MPADKMAGDAGRSPFKRTALGAMRRGCGWRGADFEAIPWDGRKAFFGSPRRRPCAHPSCLARLVSLVPRGSAAMCSVTGGCLRVCCVEDEKLVQGA